MIPQVEQRDGWWWPSTDQRCWEYMLAHPDVPQLLSNHLQPDQRQVIVQAGGNCGYYPKQYAYLFDTVYTFEPDWLNFYCLNLNVPESNVIKIQSCLGQHHHTVDLHVKAINRGKNFVSGPGSIPVLCIDDLALDACSAIQLDIEGYELYALRGAKQTIAKFRPLIVVEVWDQLSNRFEKNNNQHLEDFLDDMGYAHTATWYDSDRLYEYQP